MGGARLVGFVSQLRARLLSQRTFGCRLVPRAAFAHACDSSAAQCPQPVSRRVAAVPRAAPEPIQADGQVALDTEKLARPQASATRAIRVQRSPLSLVPNPGQSASGRGASQHHRRHGTLLVARSADPVPNAHALAVRNPRLLRLPPDQRSHRRLQWQSKASHSESLRI